MSILCISGILGISGWIISDFKQLSCIESGAVYTICLNNSANFQILVYTDLSHNLVDFSVEI